MRTPSRRRLIAFFISLSGWPFLAWTPARAGFSTSGARNRDAELLIAAASNLRPALTRIGALFAKEGGAPIRFSWGATGRLFTQIMNGAPYAVFLAADSQHPRRLEAAGRGLPDTRFTFATGRLVLYAHGRASIGRHGEILQNGAFRPLALANPRHAPYGRAARQALIRLGLWDRLRPRIVFGENVAQAFHFVASGAADLGFVALSQVIAAGGNGARWIVPERLYDPLAHQAIALRDEPAAHAFLAFLKSDAARAILRDYGYRIP